MTATRLVMIIYPWMIVVRIFLAKQCEACDLCRTNWQSLQQSCSSAGTWSAAPWEQPSEALTDSIWINWFCRNRHPAIRGWLAWQRARLYVQDISDCKYLEPQFHKHKGVHILVISADVTCLFTGLNTAQWKESRAQTHVLGWSCVSRQHLSNAYLREANIHMVCRGPNAFQKASPRDLLAFKHPQSRGHTKQRFLEARITWAQ